MQRHFSDILRCVAFCTTSALFTALYDQLASLDTHAQLTRWFSAVAELLVILRLPSTTEDLWNFFPLLRARSNHPKM